MDGDTYYAIVNDATGKIKLAASNADALSGKAIDLTGVDVIKATITPVKDAKKQFDPLDQGKQY